jgi:hypothetical protein
MHLMDERSKGFCKAAFVVLLLAKMVMAQSSGMFSPTGDMTTERMYHTATLLPNGKVLIAGGFAILSGWPVWASSELYDPATGTFSRTGSMTTPRNSHTATLLPNGKVLIAGGDLGTGGSSGSSALASAELYDPATGTFAATGSMTSARRSHTATLLNDGKVLIAGGVSYSRGAQIFLGSAELYDPSTGTFTATGSMIAPRSFHTATLLNNGKVLINSHFNYATGDDDGTSNDDLARAELYDPESGTFSLTGKTAYLSLGRVSASSLLISGKVLNTLEYSCDPAEQAEVFDPLTETFSATGKMTIARGYSSATLLPDGKVLIAGRERVGSADVYDPVAGTFSPAGEMRREEGHTATLLPDGTVLLSGGWICCGYSIPTAELYRPKVLTPSPVLLSVSADHQAAILHGGTKRVASASDPAVAGEVLEIYGTGLISGSAVPPHLAIGGLMAEVLYFGNAPGYNGLNQINVIMPSGVAPGPAVPVSLTYLDRPSNEVTIGVR